MSYGYSELENNNQVSMTSSQAGDMTLQTPNVEYSSTSIKKEIVVCKGFKEVIFSSKNSFRVQLMEDRVKL